jgi:hypothetical protein
MQDCSSTSKCTTAPQHLHVQMEKQSIILCMVSLLIKYARALTSENVSQDCSVASKSIILYVCYNTRIHYMSIILVLWTYCTFVIILEYITRYYTRMIYFWYPPPPDCATVSTAPTCSPSWNVSSSSYDMYPPPQDCATVSTAPTCSPWWLSTPRSPGREIACNAQKKKLLL